MATNLKNQSVIKKNIFKMSFTSKTNFLQQATILINYRVKTLKMIKLFQNIVGLKKNV